MAVTIVYPPRGITKTRNAHLRRVVVEAVWAYRRQPNVGGTLRKRQTVQQLAEEADAAYRAF